MLHLHNIINGIWAIEPSFAQSYIPLITAWIKNGIPPPNPSNQSTSVEISSTSIEKSSTPSEKPSTPKSIALIPISGAITKHDQWCGPVGMRTQSDRLKELYADESIKGIILVIDSGGGEAVASRLMTETLTSRNKPVIAFCDDFTCSAAYDIAAATDYVVANAKTARIGSIGSYLTIVDFSKQLEMEGIKLIEIYAGQSNDKNRDYYEALSGNHAPLKAVIDRYNDDFLYRIRHNRPDAQPTEPQWNTGKVFFADEALSLGLIDDIDSLDNVINYF